MNWMGNSILAHVLWGAGPIFAVMASYYHGSRSENILFAFETAVMMQMTLVLYFTSGIDTSVISVKSSTFTLLAAYCSSIAYFLMIMAIRQAPTLLEEITLISGTWPATTVILIFIILKIRADWLPGTKLPSLINCAGAVTVIIGLLLVNWKTEWTEKLKAMLSFKPF